MSTQQGDDIIDYNQIGNEKFILEDYLGAIIEYTKALEFNPGEAEPWYNRGNAKYNIEDFHGAIEDYSKAI